MMKAITEGKDPIYADAEFMDKIEDGNTTLRLQTKKRKKGKR